MYNRLHDYSYTALNNNIYQQAIINVTLKNGETLTLTNADIIENSLSVDRYTVTSGSISLGTGVAAELNVQLNNHDGRFDNVNFTGAKMEVGIKIDDGMHLYPETVPMGVFLVNDNPRHLSTITITALDKMTLLDKPVDRSQHTGWPRLLLLFLIDCVGQVDGIGWNPITLNNLSMNFTNTGIAISQLPVTEGILTYRQLLMWCAGIIGAVLYVNWEGSLDLMWYDCGTYDETEGTYTTDYISTPSTRYSSDIYDDLITFTGLFFKGEDKVEHLVPQGGGDYAFDLSDNKLILNTRMSMTDDYPDPYALMMNLNTYLDLPWDYRMFSASVKPAPYLWPGDSVDYIKIVYEPDPSDPDAPPIENDYHYHTTLTHVHYVLNGATTIGASGETQEEHQIAPASSGSASIPDVSANNLGVAGDANVTGNLTVGGTTSITGSASFSGNVAVGAGKLLKVVNVTVASNLSIAGGTSANCTATVNPGEGWTPICTTGTRCNNGRIIMRRVYLSGTTVHVEPVNTGTSTYTIGIQADVLCIRTSL